MHSLLQEGKELMGKIQKLDPPLQISSRRVTVTYQREPGEKNQAADAAIAAAQWSASMKHDVSETPSNDASNQSSAARQDTSEFRFRFS